MFISGHHIYEWDEAITKRPVNIAKALIDYYGDKDVITVVSWKLSNRIRGKTKLLAEIDKQLLERPIRSWNKGHVR